MKEVEEAKLGVQLCNNKNITGMLFADDFRNWKYSDFDSRNKRYVLGSELYVLYR